MSDWPWVAAAYGLTWVVLGGYAWWVLGRLRRAGEELATERLRNQRSTEEES